jgi:hypothetical protein
MAASQGLEPRQYCPGVFEVSGGSKGLFLQAFRPIRQGIPFTQFHLVSHHPLSKIEQKDPSWGLLWVPVGSYGLSQCELVIQSQKARIRENLN